MNVQSPIRNIEAGAPRGKPPQKRRGGRWLMPMAILCVVLGGAAYWYFGDANSGTPEPVVVTAARGDVEDVVTAVGNLAPLNSVDVGAQVSGQLDSLHVKIGDDVTKGQLLAEIDSSVMAAKVDADKAQLQNFQAQLAEKQSQLALAHVQADRQDKLFAIGGTSKDLLDQAQSAAKVADAQVKSVEAQINQSQSSLKADSATLSYSKIYAPMTGTVTAIPAKEGQTLNANQTAPLILTIADLTTMTVSTQVSEADVSKLRIGMEAYFTTLGNANRRFTGTLRQILPTPTVTNNVVLYTALFDVANPDKQLMTQMTAQVFFVRGSAHDAVLIPVAALQFTGRGGARAGAAPDAAAANQGARGGRNGAGRGGRGGGARGGAAFDPEAGLRPRPATVTVVKDDGMHEVRNVTVGVTDRVNAAILSGLNEGEKVIAGMQVADAGAGTQRQQQRPAGLTPPGGLPGRIGGFR